LPDQDRVEVEARQVILRYAGAVIQAYR